MLGFFLMFYLPVTAQHEADNWVFGMMDGINFSSGEPVPIDHIEMWTFYGSTSLSDHNGNLLFYSDGMEIYNRENRTMPNSNQLLGNYYNPNPCIAFLKPGSSSQYYLFTVGNKDPNNYRPGAEYSIIDMTLDGGLGDLLEGQINIPLVAADSTFEIVAGIKHGSRDAYWVILRNHRTPNRMLSFLVDESGVHQSPVVSPCILYYPTVGNQNELIKVSADGKYMCYITRRNDGINVKKAELYSINNITGILTPMFVFNTGSTNNEGIEFSANSDFLYLSKGNGLNYNLSQYDMSKATNVALFEASEVVLGSTSTHFYGNLLLSNNGKIYMVNWADLNSGDHLSVINQPGLKGSLCGFEENVYPLDIAMPGLPSFVSSFMAEFDWTGSCEGDSVKFTSNFYPTPVSYSWDFDDPASGISNTSTEINPAHLFQTTGNHTVQVSVVFPNGTEQTSSRELTIFSIPQFDLGDTLRKCKGASITLDPGIGYTSYLWSTGSTDSSLNVTTPGKYLLTVTNEGDCSYSDSVVVVDYPELKLIHDNLTVSPTTCGGNTGAITGVDFNLDPPYDISWTNVVGGNVLANTPEIFNLGVGLYKLSVIDANSCSMNDTIFNIVDVGDLLIDTVTNTMASCTTDDAEVMIVAVSGLGSRIQFFLKHDTDTLMQWHNGLFTGLGSGEYYAWAADSSGCNCIYPYPITVIRPDGPVAEMPITLPATAGLADGSVILTATSSTPGNIYYTLNGITQTNNGYFDHLLANTYICTISDEAGCYIEVEFEIKPLNLNYLEALAGNKIACLHNIARVPINVTNFKNVRSFETTLHYDPSIMECVGYGNVNSLLLPGLMPLTTSTPGVININWQSLENITLLDNDLLLELAFNTKIFGSSLVNWDQSAGIFYDQNGLEIPVKYQQGNVVVNNSPEITNEDLKICEATDYILIPQLVGGTNPLSYSWTSPTGNFTSQNLPLYNTSLADEGNYILIVKDANDCADTSKIFITVIPAPSADFEGDTMFYDKETLLQLPDYYYSYEWNTGETTSYIHVTEDGRYSVILKTSEGCTKEESIVMLNSFVSMQVPNVFTPDDDGLNDIFKPLIDVERIKRFHLSIYNRWGGLIFESVSSSKGWDGKNEENGIYNWIINYETLSGKLIQQQGYVQLLK